MAKADFDVDDAKVQEMTNRTSPEYFGLTLKKAKSHHAVVDAELELKKAQLEGKRTPSIGSSRRGKPKRAWRC